LAEREGLPTRVERGVAEREGLPTRVERGHVKGLGPENYGLKRGKRIRKGPGMPCVDEGSTLDTDVSKGE
jgi:hypothetical protein